LACIAQPAVQSDSKGVSRRATFPEPAGERIAIIETKLSNLERVNDRIDKLEEKINTLSIQISELNTKMSVVIFIGSSLGALLLAQLVTTLFTTRRPPRRYYPRYPSKGDFPSNEADRP
jgi:hypothetical protein